MTNMAMKLGKHMPRKIKKTRKEALHVKEEKKRQQKRMKSSSSGSVGKPFLGQG